jgi:hypothetical protein
MKSQRLLLHLGCTVLSLQFCRSLRQSAPSQHFARFETAINDGEDLYGTRGTTVSSSARKLIQERRAREAGALEEMFTDAWESAISTGSYSTSTTNQKCRNDCGDIVYFEDYIGGGKSSKSAKSAKSAKCSTSTSSKASSRRLKKSESSTDRSKLSRSKASSDPYENNNNHGNYEDNTDIPWCWELLGTATPTKQGGLPPSDTPSPTQAPTSTEEFERCNNIRNGTGNPSGSPTETFKLFTVVESNSTLDADFPERLNAALLAILALAAGCQNADFPSMARRLQIGNNDPDTVQMDETLEVDLGTTSCADAFGVQVSADVCTAYESLVRVYGGNIASRIVQVCTENAAEMSSSLGVENIQCVVDLPPYEFPILNPVVTVAPTASPSDDSDTERGVDKLETGGWIAIAAGILILLSLCICYLCSRRGQKEREMTGYQKDVDDESSLDTEPNPNDSVDVAIASAIPPATESPDDPNESARSRSGPVAVFTPTSEEDDIEVSKFPIDNDAPTDEETDFPRRDPNGFPVQDDGMHVTPSVSSYSKDMFAIPPRSYTQDDTVEL